MKDEESNPPRDEDDLEDENDSAEERPETGIAYDFEDENTEEKEMAIATKPQTQPPAPAPKTRAVRRGGGFLGGMRQPLPPPAIVTTPKAEPKPAPQASAKKTAIGLGSPQPPAPSPQPPAQPDFLSGLELDRFLAFAQGEPGYDPANPKNGEYPSFIVGFKEQVEESLAKGRDPKVTYRKTVEDLLEFICGRRLGGVDNGHLETMIVFLMVRFFEKNNVKPEVALPSARKWVASEVAKKLAELKAKTAEYEALASQPPAPSSQPDASLARTVEAPTPIPASKPAPSAKPAVTKAKTPQERVREAVATEVARGGFEPPEEASPAPAPVVAPRVARTPPPLPLAPVVFVPREPAMHEPQPDPTPAAQPEAKAEAEPKPRKPGIGGMDPAKRRRLIDKARSLTGEDKERFETYRARLDKETWLLEELADTDSANWLGILEGALGQAPKANKQDMRKALLVAIAIAAICLVALGIGAAIKSSRSNQTAGALPATTVVQVAPAAQAVNPGYACEPVTPLLTSVHFGQPDPAHFPDPGPRTSGKPYVECHGRPVLKNPDSSYNIKNCQVCYLK
jgi:hypothetical protein